MLNARLLDLSRERGTSISLLVADRSADWDMRSDAGCSMSLTQFGAVQTTAECRQSLYCTRAASGNQCSSLNVGVTMDMVR